MPKKFSSQLQLNQWKLWKDNYVAYDDLKLVVKEIYKAKDEKKDLSLLQQELIIKLDKELEKVNNFYQKTEKELQEKFKELQQKYDHSQVQTPRGSQIKVQHQYILQFSEQIERLRDYVFLNTKAFTKLCSKVDKKTGTEIYHQFIPKLHKSHFYVSDIVAQLQNQIYSIIYTSVSTDEPSFNNFEVPKPIIMEDFKIESLERNRIYQIWVPIVTTPTDETLSVPLLVARGMSKGPIFGINCATHGNEINGVLVVHKLFSNLDLKSLCGTIVAVLVANPPGFVQKQRTFSDGVDLNEIFPGKSHGEKSEIYAFRLLHRIIVQMEYLIDLHTAEFGKSLSFYCKVDTNDETCSRMSQLLNPQIILHENAKKGSLAAAAMALGIKSVLVAVGNPNMFQEKIVLFALTGIYKIMNFLKMLKYEEVDVTVHQPTICTDFYWICSDTGGLLEVIPEINQWVKKGEKIAIVKSVFGKLIKEYFSPEDGIVIGKTTNPVNQTGSKILHLGVISIGKKKDIEDSKKKEEEKEDE